jgi:hypothetical protein
VIAGPAVGPGAKEAEQSNLSHSCEPRGLHNVTRPLDVNLVVRLRAKLAIDPRAVRDGAAGGKSPAKVCNITQIGGEESRMGQLRGVSAASIHTARDQDNFMAARYEIGRQMASHKSCSTRDRNSH